MNVDQHYPFTPYGRPPPPEERPAWARKPEDGVVRKNEDGSVIRSHQGEVLYRRVLDLDPEPRDMLERRVAVILEQQRRATQEVENLRAIERRARERREPPTLHHYPRDYTELAALLYREAAASRRFWRRLAWTLVAVAPVGFYTVSTIIVSLNN